MTLVERLRETEAMLLRSVGTEADAANVRAAIARIEAADELREASIGAKELAMRVGDGANPHSSLASYVYGLLSDALIALDKTIVREQDKEERDAEHS